MALLYRTKRLNSKRYFNGLAAETRLNGPDYAYRQRAAIHIAPIMSEYFQKENYCAHFIY